MSSLRHVALRCNTAQGWRGSPFQSQIRFVSSVESSDRNDAQHASRSPHAGRQWVRHGAAAVSSRTKISRTPTDRISQASRGCEGAQNTNIDREGRYRLLPIRHSVLPVSFYSSSSTQIKSKRSRLGQVAVRPLPLFLVQKINAGPPWLQGNYPAGLLEKRHERLRPINVLREKYQPSGWREAEIQEEESSNQSTDEPIQQQQLENATYHTPREPLAAKRPFLLHNADSKAKASNDEWLAREEAMLLATKGRYKVEPKWIPSISITVKKHIDKRAVVRNKCQRRLLHAVQVVLPKYGRELKRTDAEGRPLALVLWPAKEIVSIEMPALIEEVDELFKALVSKLRTALAPGSTQGAHRSNFHNRRRPALVRAQKPHSKTIPRPAKGSYG